MNNSCCTIPKMTLIITVAELLFGIKNSLKILTKCSNWFCDGTFKVASAIFYQLFTILALFNQIVDDVPQIVALPIMYVLMENKTEECYKKVCQ